MNENDVGTVDNDNEMLTPSSMPTYVRLVVTNGTGEGCDTESLSTATVVSSINTNFNEELRQECDTSFVNVRIDGIEWSRRLQDGGCAKKDLPNSLIIRLE